MTFNKKILAAAVVGGLFATAAQAQVNLTAAATASTNPTLYASELVASATSPLLLDEVTENEIRSELLYAFSPGEVRYARIECSSNYLFPSGSGVAATVTSGTGSATSLGAGITGAINGLDSNAISFSITAPSGGGLASANAIRIVGDREITAAANANCEFSLYDQPSQAAAGGTAGRIVTTGARPAATFVSAYALRTSPTNRVADVNATPSFTRFTTGSGTANLGQVYFGLRGTVSAALLDSTVLATPRGANGLIIGGTAPAVQLGDILGTGSNHVITGDFTLAASAGGVYDAAARGRVYFNSTSDCAKGASDVNLVANASALTATTATFNIGATPVNGAYLCVATRTGNTIAVSTYSQTFNAVSAAPTTYVVANAGPAALGSVTRNGTSLQAPFAQVPAGWISRIVLTNTGSVPRPYTITAQTEDGTTSTLGAAASGTIPANGTIVLNTADIVTFTGNPRGTLNATIAGPGNQIQGLYQIVNGQTGSIANTAMVRPDTN